MPTSLPPRSRSCCITPADAGQRVCALADLIARVDAAAAGGRRCIIGLTGPPGAGKSTLAQRLAARAPDRIAIVPMDGFHLAGTELARLGRSDRKGAPDTFDAAGYVALLRRLRAQRAGETVYAPEFRRAIEEPIAGAIAITHEHRLVITEGNYLLHAGEHWRAVRPLIDTAWYLELAPALRVERLVARHVAFGRSAAAARAWVERSDERNAQLILATRDRADCIVQLPPLDEATP